MKKQDVATQTTELIDYYGPYQVALAMADWCRSHGATVSDRDWKAEYELLAAALTKIGNRNWSFDREEK